MTNTRFDELFGGQPRTLYYSAGTSQRRKMMAVSISNERGFAANVPQALFDFTNAALLLFRSHDLHPNGDRFLIAAPGARQVQRLVYVQNWLDEVERLVPSDG